MPQFFYDACDKDGNRIKSTIESENEQKVMDYLIQQGYFIVKIKKKSPLSTDISDLNIFQKNKNLSKKDLEFFCRHLNFIFSAGIPLAMGLDSMAEKGSNKFLQKQVFKIKENVLKGESLSYSMELTKKFPELLLSMIEIGESSGKLENIMKDMEVHYSKEAKTYQDMKNAFMYPAFTFVAMIIVVIVIMIFLVPNYTSMFEAQGAEIPPITMALINISNFFVRGYFLIPLIAIFMIQLAARFNQKLKLVIEKIKSKILFYRKITDLLIGYRLSATFRLMLTAGVPIQDIIKTTKNLIKNVIFRNHMDSILQDVESGVSLNIALRKANYFHPILLDMVQMGENTTDLASSLGKSKEYFENELNLIMSSMKKAVGPAISIVLGIILGFIMLAIMLPTFSLTDVI